MSQRKTSSYLPGAWPTRSCCPCRHSCSIWANFSWAFSNGTRQKHRPYVPTAKQILAWHEPRVGQQALADRSGSITPRAVLLRGRLRRLPSGETGNTRVGAVLQCRARGRAQGDLAVCQSRWKFERRLIRFDGAYLRPIPRKPSPRRSVAVSPDKLPSNHNGLRVCKVGLRRTYFHVPTPISDQGSRSPSHR